MRPPSGVVAIILLTQLPAACCGVVSGWTTWGNSGMQEATAVAQDANGYTYVAGYTDAADFPVVNAAFARGGGVDAFVIKLDPSWNVVFSTWLGGSGDDRATAVGVDAQGNVYVAGTTSSSSLAGAMLAHRGAAEDGFVVKLDPTGQTVLYAIAVGGSLNDTINAMAVRSDGTVFVAGQTGSPDLPVVNAAQSTLRGLQNAFAVELAPSGTVVYCTYAGGNGSDGANGIAVDGNGIAWIAGSTTSSDFPLQSPWQSVLTGRQAGFVTRISADGAQFLFSTYLGGSGGGPATPESANAVAVDAQGNAFVAGITSSADFPILHGWQPSYGGFSDAYLSSFDGGGNVRFSTWLGGTAWDCAYSVAVLPDGRVAVSGDTLSSDFPVSNSEESWQAGGYLGFVSVFDNAGDQVMFSTYAEGGPSNAILASTNTNPMVLGGVQSNGSPATGTLATAAQVTIPSGTPLLFVPVTPCRVVDTRYPNGDFGSPSLTAGGTRSFAVPSGSCNIPASAAAYSLNVTVVPHGQLWYVSVWPTGSAQPYVSTLNSLDGRIKANAAIIPAGTNGAVSVYATGATDVILDIDGYFVPATSPNALAFYPLPPCRIADTRYSSFGALGSPSLGVGQTRSFDVLSSGCNVPASAQAYSLNFTVVPRASLLFITTFPTGQTQPNASTLNDPTGTIVANAAIVPAGTGGAVSVYNYNATTDLIVDIDGYFAPPGAGGLALYNLSPCRVLDTRQGGGAPFSGEKDVDVMGSGCGAPAAAQAYVFNATVVPPGLLWYLTLWPQGAAQPWVSTLNATDGAITSNMAIVPTSNGSVSASPSDPAHLILDIFGYFAP